MTRTDEGKRRIKSADKAFDIIDIVGENPGVGVGYVADELGLAKSTVHQYLYTLTDRGYIVKQDGQYYLGLRLFEHGQSAKRRYDFLDDIQSSLDGLAAETGEVVWFMVEENGMAVYLTKAVGENAIQAYAYKGQRNHLHCIAAGKAILAHLSDERVYDIIERYGLPDKTDDTLTTHEELERELSDIREKGYAINKQESVSHVNAIAAPVLVQQDTVIGSLTVAGPARRMNQKQFETEFTDPLLSATDEISLQLEWDQ
jgi:DNA-binding IclR family transcriptional regulator